LYQKSQHGVQLKNKLYQFPPRVIDWLSVLSLYQLVKYGVSFLWSKAAWITRRFNAETFPEMIISRFGKQFYQDIVAPMTEKVWIEPEAIDQSFVAQRFAQIHPLTVLKKLVIPKQDMNPSHFIYPRKGFQQLWDRAKDYSATQGHVFHMESRPKKIVVEKALITQIELESPVPRTLETAKAKVICTIPITVFLKSLEVHDSSLDLSALAELAQKIKFRSMILACFEFHQPDVLPFRTQIYPEKHYVFNRLFEQNKYSRDTVEDGKSVVVADITYPLGGWADEQSDAELLSLVEDDLRKLGYIPLEKVSDRCLRRVPYAYVVPDKEGKAAMHRLLHHLKRLTNVQFAGRFSVGEYDNSDYALMNGITLSSLLSDRISRLEYLKRIHLQFNPIVG
jgi:protoporphyrinogen oxidase